MSEVYVPTLGHPNPPVNRQAEIAKVLSGSAAEQLTITRRLTKSVILTGKKGNNTDNTGTIYVGFNSTNQPIAVAAGATITIDGDSRAWDNDLSGLWLSGTSGDGVVADFQEGIA